MLVPDTVPTLALVPDSEPGILRSNHLKSSSIPGVTSVAFDILPNRISRSDLYAIILLLSILVLNI